MNARLPVRLSASLAGAFALAVAVAATPAAADPCYVVLDRSDRVIYQGLTPPVDMSSEGTPARDAMRRRGELLEQFDSTRCTQRSAKEADGKGEESVDQIVSQIKPYQRAGRAAAQTVPDDKGGTFATRQSDVVRININ
jgi:hypothetical protein